MGDGVEKRAWIIPLTVLILIAGAYIGYVILKLSPTE